MRVVHWIPNTMVDTIKIGSSFAESYNIGLSVIDPALYGFGDSFNIGLAYHTSGGDEPPFKLKFSEQLGYKDPEAKDESGDALTAQARKFKGYGGRHISFSTFLSRPTWLDQPLDPNNLELNHLTPESAVWVLKEMASKHRAQRPTEVGAPMYPKNMITRGRGGLKTVVVPYHPVTTYPEVSRVPLLVFTYGAMRIAPCIITDLSFNYQGWRPMWEGLSEAEVSIELQEIMTRVSTWIPNEGTLSSRAFRPSHREFITEREGFRKERVRIKAPESETSVGRESAPAVISKAAVSNREWIARGRSRARLRGR